MLDEPVATPAKTPGAAFNMSIANSSVNGSGFLSPLLLEGPPVTREAMATSFEALKGAARHQSHVTRAASHSIYPPITPPLPPSQAWWSARSETLSV